MDTNQPLTASLTLLEFCQATRLERREVHELIGFGIIAVTADAHFDSEQVVRCIKARRLQHDLELDLHSVALVLDLLDQNRHMQRRLQHLEQLIQRLHN